VNKILKSVYVFDWDGTILESMQIKFYNFSTVLYELHKDSTDNIDYTVGNILHLYQKFSGIPRIEIYKKILDIYSIEYKKKEYDSFSRELSLNNKEALLKANVYEDAVLFLQKVLDKNKTIYISSSVPQEELSFLVKNRLSKILQENISGVFGSRDGFSKGKEHFDEIINIENVAKEEIMFFGDDLMDFNLAQEAGVDFLLVNRDNKKTDCEFIKSFNEEKIL